MRGEGGGGGEEEGSEDANAESLTATDGDFGTDYSSLAKIDLPEKPEVERKKTWT